MTYAALEKELSKPAGDGDDSPVVFAIDTVKRKPASEADPSERTRTAGLATLEELAAAIVHEVSQPLTAVLTNAEAGLRWLQRSSPDVEEARWTLECIRSEARRANDIVRGIRGWFGMIPLGREALTVHSLVEDAIRLVQPDLASAEVDLRVETGGSLPAVIGNRVQLQQILVNLILNATQAMVGQSTPRRIVVTCEPKPDCVAIGVCDTGPGIAKEHVDRLFDPFFTTKRDGMGLGLAICRMTVEAHGGRILVESPPGGGARFQLVLPIGQSDVAA